MSVTKEDLRRISTAVGYQVPEKDVDDFTTLLARAKQTFETVSAMEDYQPTPDFILAPRLNVHFPDEAANPLNAWAWRCECAHASPSSTTLEGKTVCLKDNIALAQVPCLLGTESFTGWTPTVDATIATRVLEAGGHIVGKAVCENLSRGAVSVTAATGPVHNPYARGYSAGGSSSGTAALVAAGEVDLGIGCDQGGSVRIPAAMCGLYGLKPTFGLVPYTGIASNDASVDFVGPMTRTCFECATLLEVLAGADGLDDRQGAGCPFPGQVPRYADGLKASSADGAKGLRIGILKEGLEGAAMNDAVKAKFLAAVQVFTEKIGAAVVEEVSVPLHTSSRAIYSVMSKMSNHMGMLGRATGRRQVMLTDLAERKAMPYTQDALSKMSAFSHEGLLAGELGWSEYPLAYGKAVNLARQLRDSYDAVLGVRLGRQQQQQQQQYDLLILPTTLRASFPLPAVDSSPVAHMDAGRGMTENTACFNGTGHPALAMPIGFVPSEADPNIMVPCSLQIVGKFWDEMTILKAAYAWEQAVNWRTF
ncbi:amidase signature enzyme [Apiospora arundinis]